MNHAETQELIGKVKILWPSTKLDLDYAYEWGKVLENIDFTKASEAVNQYGSEGNRFAPNVFDIKERAKSSMMATAAGAHDVQAEAAVFRQYLRQNLFPVFKEQDGHMAVSFHDRAYASACGKAKQIKYLGVPCTGFFMDEF